MRTTCTCFTARSNSDFCVLCGASAKDHCIEDGKIYYTSGGDPEQFPVMVTAQLDALDMQIDPIWRVSKSVGLDLKNIYRHPGRVIRVNG